MNIGKINLTGIINFTVNKIELDPISKIYRSITNYYKVKNIIQNIRKDFRLDMPEELDNNF